MESKLVWMNGPFKAGLNNAKIFKEKGLKKLAAIRKKAIGNRGYRGNQGEVSWYNPHECEEVQVLCSQAP